jgi:outer membrane protein insertion porin family
MIEQLASGKRRRSKSVWPVMAAIGLTCMSGLALAAAVGDDAQTGERIVRVVVRGNERVPTHRILGQMRLREGSVYSPAAADEDLKRIYALGEFENVTPRPQREADGLVLLVDVVERPAIDRVVFDGSRAFKERDLAEAVGVTVGSPVDLAKLTMGVRTLEQKYREAGYTFASVKLDQEALSTGRVARYVISEGPKVRISKITFTGNASIGSGELERKI